MRRGPPRGVLRQQRPGPDLLLVEDLGDLLIDEAGGVVGVLAATGHQVLAEEHLLAAVPGHRSDLLAHAPLADHAPGEAGDDLEVVRLDRVDPLAVDVEFALVEHADLPFPFLSPLPAIVDRQAGGRQECAR